MSATRFRAASGSARVDLVQTERFWSLGAGPLHREACPHPGRDILVVLGDPAQTLAVGLGLVLVPGPDLGFDSAGFDPEL